MTNIVTRARLPIEAGVGTVGVQVIADDYTLVISRTTSGIHLIFDGDGFGEYAKTITLPTGLTQGFVVWDDGSRHGTSEAFNLIESSGGGGSADSGGGIVRGWIAHSSLSPDEYLQIIQGEEKILTFVCEANGRFDQTSADEIQVIIQDVEGNVILKVDSDVTRVCEQLDVQVFRITLSPTNTNTLQEGLLSIEVSFDTQKCRIEHTMKVLEAL